MLTIWIHLDTGDVRKANVPEDYSTGDLLADVLRSTHPGSPRTEWGMYDDVPEKVLSLGKTLAQNQIQHDAHLHLFSRINLALEVDAPGFSATRREVSPSTLTRALLTDLVRHYQLAGLPTDWLLVQTNSNRTLDPDKSLSANGVHSGEWLSVKPRPVPVLPVRPKLVSLSIADPRSGKTQGRTLSGGTVLNALLRDAVETFALPQATRTGRAQGWIFVQDGSRDALDLDRTLDANGIKDGSVLHLKGSVVGPELVLKMIAPGGAVKDVEAEAALGTEHLLRTALRAFALPETQHGRPRRYRLQDKSRDGKDLDLTRTLGQNGVGDGASLQILPPVAFPWLIAGIAAAILLSLVLLGSLLSYLFKQKIDVQLTSSRTALTAGGTAQFTARLTHAKDPTVLWSLSPKVGEITSDGAYTAPGSLGGMVLVRVTAISREDTGRSASLDLTLSPAPLVVAQTEVPPPVPETSQLSTRVVPGNASISAGQSRRFAVSPDPGEPVKWQISPSSGKIGPDGVYTAPGTVGQDGTVTLTALLASGESAGSAIIHLRSPTTPPATRPDTATIDGIQATRGENGQTVFRAFSQGGKTAAVNWSLSPELGTISAEGVYTPPTRMESAREITVRAASPANPGNVAAYTLRVAATYPSGVSVLVSPEEHAVLRPGDRKNFSATVKGTGNTLVTWSAMGGGNIFPNGLYVAPPNVPPSGSNVRIRATSNANPAVYGEAEITLRPNVAPIAPRQGTFLWQGKLKRNQTLTIHSGIASTGNVSGTLPEGAVEVHLTAGDCEITIAPSAANSWSVIAVKARSSQTSLSFGWTSLSVPK